MDLNEVCHVIDRIPGRPAHNSRRYAVLMPLVETDHGAEFLFEVRASSLKRQPGEICFPGGRVEQGEELKTAAIRETSEELLLSTDRIRVISAGTSFAVSSGGRLTPFVGVLDRYEYTYSEEEVESVFTVPIDWFLSHEPEAFPVQATEIPGEDFPYERIPGGKNYHWGSTLRYIYFYQYEEYTIWGMTAWMLHCFMEDFKNARSGEIS